VREPDHVQHLGDLLADLPARLALDAQRVADVLGSGAVREELEVLEHTTDVAAQERDLGALEAVQVTAADDDSALRRLELLEDEPDDRRLPGARGADDEDELALVDREGDPVECDDVRVVDLLHVLEHDHGGAARLRLRRPRRRELLRIEAVDLFGLGFGEGCHGDVGVRFVFQHRAKLQRAEGRRSRRGLLRLVGGVDSS
jgi:hypothetical protein